MIEVNKISYKTVSKAELGLSKSHMTHIGFAENTFDDWKKRISIKTKLNIFFDKNNKTTIQTFLFNDPIKHPTQGLRSPKFRSGSDEELPSLRDSIIYFYKINMKNSVGTPLLILFDLKKSQYKLEAFLISPSHNIFKQLISSLSHPLITRNNSGEIYSKLITSTNNYSKDFKIISQLYKDNISNKETLKESEVSTSNNFNINNVDSEKKNVKTSINRNRIGQQNFRINVLSAYKYQCCVTRSDLIDAIEANHIHPYFGVNTNHVQNGIPLRADIHKLWTKGLLGINDQFKVILSEKAKNSESYKKYHGQTIMLPTNPKYHPDKEALLRWCNLHELI